MRYKDILKLAMLRLKNKNSKRTIIIMAFGLIMLIPVLWLIFSFYFNFYNTIQESQSIDMAFMIDSEFEQEVDIRGGESSRKLYQDSIERELTFEQYEEIKTDNTVDWFSFQIGFYNSSLTNTHISIGEKEFDAKDRIDCKFLLSESVMLDSIQDYLYTSTGHDAIYGQGFSESKREVLVSELWLKENGLTKEDALGKEISLDMNYSGVDLYNNFNVVLDNDTIFENQHISSYDKNYQTQAFVGNISVFTKYKIVGVVCEEYYSLNDFTEIDSDFWFKKSALVDNNGNSVYPKLCVQDIHINEKLTPFIVATYPSTDYVAYSQEVTDQGCFFPFLQGNIHRNHRTTFNIYPVKSSFVQYDSFKEAKSISKKLENILGDYAGYGFEYGTTTLNFYRLVLQDRQISIACGVMGLVGGITLITVIANYGSAVCFNARKRKDFLQMMYRMGITQKEKQKLVWTETVGIYILASIIAFVVSLFIVIVIKLAVDSILKEFVASTVFKISLIYFIPAFLILFMGVGLIVMSISLVSGKIIRD